MDDIRLEIPAQLVTQIAKHAQDLPLTV